MSIDYWPGPPLIGTLFLAYLGFAGGFAGILLWPAVALHLILTALLTRNATRIRRD